MARHWVFRLPIIRGVMALGESLAIGFRALAISANYAAQERTDGPRTARGRRPSSRAARSSSRSPSRSVSPSLLFKVTPGLLTELLPIKGTGWFVIVEGLIRVTIFVAYLALISLLPDLRRVFQYHAAEHKAINAYEAGEELEPEIVQRFSLIHPRCGTAFMLWVMVIAVFVFAFFGRPHWYWLIATRILLLPLIAGLAYELIRFAGKHQGNRVADDAARARHVAAAADDARADARPARGLDPRAARGAEARGERSHATTAWRSWPDGNRSSCRRRLDRAASPKAAARS